MCFFFLLPWPNHFLGLNKSSLLFICKIRLNDFIFDASMTMKKWECNTAIESTKTKTGLERDAKMRTIREIADGVPWWSRGTQRRWHEWVKLQTASQNRLGHFCMKLHNVQ